MRDPSPQPPDCNAALVLADGTVFWGRGLGASGAAVGKVGANPDDTETATPAARGLVVKSRVTAPANWRATTPFERWVEEHGLVGVYGVDTRRLTRRVRDGGPPNGVIAFDPRRPLDIPALAAQAAAWPGLE